MNSNTNNGADKHTLRWPVTTHKQCNYKNNYYQCDIKY